jgi:hypothetical protein
MLSRSDGLYRIVHNAGDEEAFEAGRVCDLAEDTVLCAGD